MVDTNSDPRDVDFVIPSNDDASKSIDKILDLVTGAVKEGLSERKKEKEGNTEEDLKNMEAVAKADEDNLNIENGYFAERNCFQENEKKKKINLINKNKL